VAICLNDIPKDDPSWLNGSPYAVAEQVIDENDLTACSADGFEAEGFDLSKAKKRKTLQDAIDGITPETRHKEIDSGNVGRERFWET
jgi:antitoxin component of MazEF toxin-antitoxin module